MMGDMPSYGSRTAGAEDEEKYQRADDFYVLMRERPPHKHIETMRSVLGADADALAALVESDGGAAYNDLRNLQCYAQALSRLTETAIERVVEAEDQARIAARAQTEAEADDGADATEDAPTDDAETRDGVHYGEARNGATPPESAQPPDAALAS